MSDPYDRTAEDLGNIVALEHVNVAMPDQQVATAFYIGALGLTRDPYLQTGLSNMWINIGRSQFHTPTGDAQVLRGYVALVLPDREALLERLTSAKGDLDGTQFSFVEHDDFIEVTSPWGNRLHCFEPEERFGRINLGMPYIEFDVPVGSAPGIARFYREFLGSRAEFVEDELGPFARCSVGNHQDFYFRESERPLPAYDGHHVQIYLADFSGPHDKLAARGLVFEESDQWQYRFRELVDPESGEVLHTIEHEVRSMTHPLYGRPLVNRNPNQSNRNFVAGNEAWSWATA